VLLPLLSFCLCFENVLLFRGDSIEKHSALTDAGHVFQALQIPLFIIIIYELPFRLHEARLAHFCCIPFDQGKYMLYIFELSDNISMTFETIFNNITLIYCQWNSCHVLTDSNYLYCRDKETTGSQGRRTNMKAVSNLTPFRSGNDQKSS
jgi:hypothetical protein